MVDVSTVSALLASVGALGVGSILGQYVGDSRDRRETRAQALSALRAVETARWAPGETGAPTFQQAARELEAAALVAGIPWILVTEYLAVAQASYWLSAESYENNPEPGPGGGGGVNFDLAQAVRGVAALLAETIWRPRWTRRYRLRRRLNVLRTSAESTGETDCDRALARSHRVYGV